jgi:hypothetical protein
MENKIHIWNLKGYVLLEKEFVIIYKKKLKEYGVCKLAKELNVDYATIANLYRRDKLMDIKLLEEVSEILKIDKNVIEKSVRVFTQNLKNKYFIEFPFKITPLHLRAVSMVLGDGNGSLAEYCRWTQKTCNIRWGVLLIKKIVNNTPKSRSKCGGCKVLGIPSFIIQSIFYFLGMKGGQIKSQEFFEKVCNLHREWIFQVFAQLVVDEGTPDRTFTIAQYTKEVKEGIIHILDKLGYHFSDTKTGVYINTESFIQIKKDLENAKNKFGKIGGFWFKEYRFYIAFENVNPTLSRHSRIYTEYFNKGMRILKNSKKMFRYCELKRLSRIPDGSLVRRINKALKDGVIIKITHDLYCFSEYKNNKRIRWLGLSKYQKLLFVLSKYKIARTCKLISETELSDSEFYRGINCLIHNNRVTRKKIGIYEKFMHSKTDDTL